MFVVGAAQNTVAHIILSQTGKPSDLIGMYIMKESGAIFIFFSQAFLHMSTFDAQAKKANTQTPIVE